MKHKLYIAPTKRNYWLKQENNRLRERVDLYRLGFYMQSMCLVAAVRALIYWKGGWS